MKNAARILWQRLSAAAAVVGIRLVDPVNLIHHHSSRYLQVVALIFALLHLLERGLTCVGSVLHPSRTPQLSPDLPFYLNFVSLPVECVADQLLKRGAVGRQGVRITIAHPIAR